MRTKDLHPNCRTSWERGVTNYPLEEHARDCDKCELYFELAKDMVPWQRSILDILLIADERVIANFGRDRRRRAIVTREGVQTALPVRSFPSDTGS